jgi:hypothetical protein
MTDCVLKRKLKPCPPRWLPIHLKVVETLASSALLGPPLRWRSAALRYLASPGTLAEDEQGPDNG